MKYASEPCHATTQNSANHQPDVIRTLDFQFHIEFNWRDSRWTPLQNSETKKQKEKQKKIKNKNKNKNESKTKTKRQSPCSTVFRCVELPNDRRLAQSKPTQTNANESEANQSEPQQTNEFFPREKNYLKNEYYSGTELSSTQPTAAERESEYFPCGCRKCNIWKNCNIFKNCVINFLKKILQFFSQQK